MFDVGFVQAARADRLRLRAQTTAVPESACCKIAHTPPVYASPPLSPVFEPENRTSAPSVIATVGVEQVAAE